MNLFRLLLVVVSFYPCLALFIVDFLKYLVQEGILTVFMVEALFGVVDDFRVEGSYDYLLGHSFRGIWFCF